jgi:excisionase family DNA binding protein
METHLDAAGGQTAGPESRPEENAELLTARDCARLLRCSVRHIYRLTDSGAMPRPVRLGQLVRWSRRVLLEWLANGCRPVRRTGGA